jgi:hypothetical protein
MAAVMPGYFFMYDYEWASPDWTSPLGRRRKLRLSQLIDEPWALPPSETVIGRLIADGFRACGLGVPQGNVITASLSVACRTDDERTLFGNLGRFPAAVQSAPSFTQSPPGGGANSVLAHRHHCP